MAEKIPCGAYYLYKDAKSPYWQVRAEDAPRTPLWKSTKEENLVNAKKAAKEIYADWASVKNLKASEHILFKDLWREYAEERATYDKTATKTRRDSVAELHLLPAFGNRFLHEIQALWPKFVRTQKMKRPGTALFNERKALVGALQYAYDHSLLDKVPPIPTVVGKKKPICIFTDSQIKALLDGCGENDELRLNILLGFCMGMRHGEIAKLELAHIDLRTKTIQVKETKTKRDRTIAINLALIEELKAQMNKARAAGSSYLFPQVHNPGKHKDQRVFDKAWQALKDDLGIEGNFHGLRHSCANRLKQSHVPPAVAAAYLGMSMRVFDSTYGQLGVEDTKTAAGIIRLPQAVDLAVENLIGGQND